MVVSHLRTYGSLKEINVMPRYTQLVSLFRTQILEGRLSSGARLPTEMDLAREHGVSRGTVRQAMTLLVQEGFVERVQGRGTFVRELTTREETIPAVERRIGLVLPYMRDQLSLDILIGVEHAIKSRGYQISFAYADERVDQQVRDIQRLRADRVAGLIVFPVSDIAYDESIWQLKVDGVPFVLIDRYFPDLECDYVVADNLGGAYRAIEHLLILGHTRIGFLYDVHAGLQSTSVRDRYEGYRKALSDYGVPFDDDLVMLMGSRKERDQLDAFVEVLQRPNLPGAVFAVNDFLALSLLQAARRTNILVPDDLALVSFDDVSLSAHISPALTTVSQPRMDIGMRAGNLLLNRIEGYTGPCAHIELPTNLMIRESCGARLRVRQSVSAR